MNLGLYMLTVKNGTVMAPPALYTASDTNAMSHRLFKGSPKSFYFWNQYRKEAYPTWNDSEFEWHHFQSTWSRSRNSSFNFSVVVYRIRLFPTLNDSEFESSIDFESIWKFNFRVIPCRIRLFPILISKMKWFGSGLTFSSLDLCATGTNRARTELLGTWSTILNVVKTVIVYLFFNFLLFRDCYCWQNKEVRTDLIQLLLKSLAHLTKPTPNPNQIIGSSC